MEGEANHLFDQFMALSQAAFEAGYYEAAYHGLTAALHVVESAQLEDKALTVAETAQEQARWVNQHAPESRMSGRAAEKRGGVDFYQMLIRQAHIHRTIIRQNKRRAEGLPPEWHDVEEG
jgi:hypothetical protein